MMGSSYRSPFSALSKTNTQIPRNPRLTNGMRIHPITGMIVSTVFTAKAAIPRKMDCHE